MTLENQEIPLPTYFLSHGGGPWPYMKEQTGPLYARLEASLVEIPRRIGAQPRALLVVSGHWEERELAVQSGPNPPMLYDYSGFPEYTYQVRYPAPGSPELAEEVRDLLEEAGFRAHLDPERGFDHGTFSPLAVMYPEAQVPVVQLSLKRSLDPAEHLDIGRALAPLRVRGILLLGSGLSYHNLRDIGPRARAASSAFDAWLQETLAAPPSERARRLVEWEKAPAARLAHPREEHLLPLLVAAGAAFSEKAECIYHEEDFLGGTVVSSFRFGGPQ